ncbi:maleylpyruvate isomerase N-terminal domain-containing protein [Streptomyces sp. NPDC060028]|uniref:maleylpyruvate isomerase N-terminal domain-containing protein n=1 Tax=Streptomyces sp. NPDC060028 TaxID=3347041 RepID=UPI00368CF8C1
MPRTLTDWFAEGARDLAGLLGELGPQAPVWTWSAEQTSGFWLRMQLIELAVHRRPGAACVGLGPGGLGGAVPPPADGRPRVLDGGVHPGCGAGGPRP